MKKHPFAPIAAALALGALTIGMALPAFADGAVSFKNSTIDRPVAVEVREGNTQADSIPVATQSLAKGQMFSIDATNLQVFWRREANPGSGDGKMTDWQRVDTRGGDSSVEI